MDLDKFKIFSTGMTEDERAAQEREAEANAIFEKEANKVKSTINSPGFRVIINKMVADMEVAKAKLLRCKEKDLAKLQLEIQVRSEFLNKWSPYQS